MEILFKGRGRVKEWNPTNGYGFISLENQIINDLLQKPDKKYPDIFVHYSSLSDDDFTDVDEEGNKSTRYKKLIEQQIIELDISRNDKGYFGVNVKIIGSIVGQEGDANGNI